MKYKKSLQCNTGIIVQDPLGIEKLKVYKKVRNVFYELFLYQIFFSRTAEPLEIMKMIN